MPFPNLIAGERIELHLHPHWKVLVLPALWGLLFVSVGAIATVLAILADDPLALREVGPVDVPDFGPIQLPAAARIGAGGVAVTAFVLYLWHSFSPYIRWRCTHYVFTNKRVLRKEGVFRHNELGVPLSKVNDVRINQGFGERIFGFGTLTLESAGEQGNQALHDLPKVREAARVLTQLVEAYEPPTSESKG
jgi:membrane protein YdbS with pleckstrin-like domain